ncbi:MAG: hypothetical protein ACYC2U_07470 [Candidatus Amoebophilus sp.]
MKERHNISQQFIARLLLISLCLQSCGGLAGQPIHISEEQTALTPINCLTAEEYPEAVDINNEYQYEDIDIQAILGARVENITESSFEYQEKSVHILAAVDNIIPGQLQHRLEEERLEEERQSNRGGRVLLIPCNLGNSHWVGILIEIDAAQQVVRAAYIDSLEGANGNSSGV